MMKNKKLFISSILLVLIMIFSLMINTSFTKSISNGNNQPYLMNQFTPKDNDIIFTIKSVKKTDKNSIENQSWEQATLMINENLASFQSTSLLPYLHQAEIILNDWLKNSSPTYETYLYQARLAQMQHFFDSALTQLDYAIAINPEKPEAYLLKAYIKINSGKPLEAIPLCKKSIHLSPLLSLSCLSTAQARIGQEDTAYEQLQKALVHFNNLTDIEKSEAYYSLAEISIQKNIESDAYFTAALAHQPNNMNARIRFIDALIEKKEYALSQTIIKDYDQHPAIKTRKLYIDKILNKKTSHASYQEMLEYFQTQSLIDQNYSSREQAFFYFYIENNPELSLKASYQNWKNHPEPEDALMVIKCAVLLQDQQKIQEIMQWKNNSGYQDERFNLIMNNQL